MQQQQINIDIKKTKLIRCDCGNPFYKVMVVYREVPGLLLGQSKNIHQPFQVMLCDRCERPHPSSAPFVEEPETEKTELPF